jgi:sulfhydrogenase subunit beta (sulfur reductase)
VPQDFGPLACVGCGRCVVECPVNIDIREMLTDIQTKA